MAAVLSGLATSLGALPFLFVRNLARRTYDGILGLGAGLMLAAATLGLLAEAVRGVHEGGSLDVTKLALVVAGFVVGVGLAAAMDRFIPHHRRSPQHLGQAHYDVHDRAERRRRAPPRRGTPMRWSARSACTARRAGHRRGSPCRAPPASDHLAIAVGVQERLRSVVMSAPRASGVSPRRGFVIVALTGCGPIAAAIGRCWRAWPRRCRSCWRSRADLIYVTSNEIIPGPQPATRAASAGLVLGFLLTMLLEAVLLCPAIGAA